jgi:hypothetical protein
MIQKLALTVKLATFKHLAAFKYLDLQELQLTGCFAKIGPKLESLGSSFPTLTSLVLLPDSRINQNGCLRRLSTLTTLRSLEVHNVASDAGLDALQQLRNLKLVLPPHEACPLDDMVCECCGELVEERLDNFIREEIDWNDQVCVGRYIRSLPHLQSLTIQFSASPPSSESHLDMSPCLNHFFWRNFLQDASPAVNANRTVDSDSDDGTSTDEESLEPKQQHFPSLTTINLINIYAPWSLIYMRYGHMFQHFNSGTTMWNMHVIHDAFASMPKLQHWRMVPGEPGPLDESPIGDGVGRTIEWSCDCGHELRINVIQEGEEVVYDALRPAV